MCGVKNYKEDLIFGLICFAAGLGFYINVHMQEVMKFDLLGSKFFPKVACAGIMFFGGLLALQAVSKIKATAGSRGRNSGCDFFNIKKLLFVAYSVFYFTALELSVGFIYATPIYIFLNMLLLERKKPSVTTAVIYMIFSVAVTVATYQFFSKVLYLLLP